MAQLVDECDPNTLTGNDFDQLEQGRHSATGKESGGSNYAFADGSTRYYRYWGTVKPINLWGVTEMERV